VREISWRSLCHPLFLRVYRLTVLVELRLNRLLIVFAIRSMAGAFCSEGDRSTTSATGLYWNVAEPFRYAYRWLFHLRDCPAFLTLGSFSRRTNESPRFSSAVRSVLSVATCTGFPDSFPSQAFSSWGVVLTNRPWHRTGIPSDAHRWTTEVGSPKKAATCCQPFRISAFLVIVLHLIDTSAQFLRTLSRSNWPKIVPLETFQAWGSCRPTRAVRNG